MKPGDVVLHKATAEPMVLIENPNDATTKLGQLLCATHMAQDAHGKTEYETIYLSPLEVETFEERAVREREMQKFLFDLSENTKIAGPRAVN